MQSSSYSNVGQSGASFSANNNNETKTTSVSMPNASKLTTNVDFRHDNLNILSTGSISSVSTTSLSTFGHDRQPSVQLKIESTNGPYFAKKVSLYEKIRRNLNYFLSQLIILLSQLSPIVQSFSCLIILLYLIQFGGEITVDFFALIPSEIISPGQWYHTVIAIWSHAFLETQLLMVILDLIILSFCGTLIEPLWGHKEVLRFMTITIISSSLLTCLHYVLLYCCTFDDNYLFNVRIHGFLSFCAAVAVTVKQLLPQSILIATSFGKLKNDHIAFSTMVIAIILYLVNIFKGVQVILLMYGIFTSWLYLRFLQSHTRHWADSTTTTITRGDLSDSFAFETFFPNVLRPLVSIISTNIYNFFVKLNICPKIPSPAAQLLEDNHYSTYFSGTGSSLLHNYVSHKHYPNSNHPLNGSLREPLLEQL